jgi:DNA-binding winged helix-turn-helix (wHTH) protein/tetratricopeptide (TPR) repeat protein
MANGTYQFGDYRVSPGARELMHRGELVVLSPKVFDCLAYLIEHRERAVGRDELISAVWGKLDVSDTLLGQTILKARRAVGDTGNEQNAIRTIPRFGYRWIAEVDVLPDPSEEAGSGPVPAGPDPARRAAAATRAETTPAETTAGTSRSRSFVIAALAAAALVAVIGLALVRLADRTPDTVREPASSTAGNARRVAVLPVAVDAPEDFSWVRLGIMDLVATRLRRAGQPVIPSDNVVALAKPGSADADDADVRLATGAADIIRSSARRTETGQWIVRAELRSPNGAVRAVESRATEVTQAGRRAADEVLGLLGLVPPNGREEAQEDLSLAERLSRAEAALLSDDLDPARELLQAAPADARASPEWGLRMVQVDYRAGQLGAARRRVDALLVQVSAEADPILHGRLLNALGAIDMREDRIADAQRAFTSAVSLLDERGQPAALGQAYTGLGTCNGALGDYELALGNFSRARIALEIAGDNLALARVEANEALVEARLGHYASAISHNERASSHFERFGALNELVATLGNLAEAQLAQLQPDAALATLARADPALEGLENRVTRNGLEMVRVTALAADGQLVAARALLGRLAEQVASGDDAPLLARVRMAQARFDLLDGQADRAVERVRFAVATLDSRDYVRDRAQAWLTLSRALHGARQDAQATVEAGRFADWAARTANSAAEVAAQLAQAERAWAARDRTASRNAYAAALTTAERSGVPGDIGPVIVSWANRLIAEGELERATTIAGRAARWAGSDFDCALLQVRLYHALGQPDAWRHALQNARTLAGERPIPADLATAPPTTTRTAAL